MKQLLLLMLMFIVLVACDDKAEENVMIDKETYETYVAFKPNEKLSSKGNKNIRFNGFTFQTFEGKWIVSFSEYRESAVNTTFIVSEGDYIHFSGERMKIVKLLPNENKIVVKFE